MVAEINIHEVNVILKKINELLDKDKYDTAMFLVDDIIYRFEKMKVCMKNIKEKVEQLEKEKGEKLAERGIIA